MFSLQVTIPNATLTESAGAVEYADCTATEEVIPPLMSVLSITQNCIW